MCAEFVFNAVESLGILGDVFFFRRAASFSWCIIYNKKYIYIYSFMDIILHTNIYIYTHRIRFLECKEYQLISMFV